MGGSRSCTELRGCSVLTSEWRLCDLPGLCWRVRGCAMARTRPASPGWDWPEAEPDWTVVSVSCPAPGVP